MNTEIQCYKKRITKNTPELLCSIFTQQYVSTIFFECHTGIFQYIFRINLLEVNAR